MNERQACLLLLAALSLHAQALDPLLARLDKAAAAFTGAKADIRRASYTASIHVTEVETGTLVVRRSSPGKVEFRIDITGDNAFSLVVRGETAEYYHPAINQIDVTELRQYRGIVQTLMALGFGMSGRDLKANYTISNLRRDTVTGQATAAIDLAPKSPDLVDRFHLQKVELWIADGNLAPVKEKVYFRGGDTWTIEYTNVQMNAKVPTSALDLPKSAKRIKRN